MVEAPSAHQPRAAVFNMAIPARENRACSGPPDGMGPGDTQSQVKVSTPSTAPLARGRLGRADRDPGGVAVTERGPKSL
jgi:hypothetical protein